MMQPRRRQPMTASTGVGRVGQHAAWEAWPSPRWLRWLSVARQRASKNLAREIHTDGCEEF